MTKRVCAAAMIAALATIMPQRVHGQQVENVIVQTGNVADAGTDANVCVRVIGSSGQSTPTELDKHGRDDFEKGRTDDFPLAVNVPDIERVRLFHNNRGKKPGWYVQTTTLRGKDAAGRTWEQVFGGNRWLAVDTGDKQTCVEMSVGADTVARPCPFAKVKFFVGPEARQDGVVQVLISGTRISGSRSGGELTFVVPSFAQDVGRNPLFQIQRTDLAEGTWNISVQAFGAGSFSQTCTLDVPGELLITWGPNPCPNRP